jgi:hypothetical protein
MVQDSLARMVERFKRANGAKSFPYLPKTYLLPDDRDKVQTPVSSFGALACVRACVLVGRECSVQQEPKRYPGTGPALTHGGAQLVADWNKGDRRDSFILKPRVARTLRRQASAAASCTTHRSRSPPRLARGVFLAGMDKGCLACERS